MKTFPLSRLARDAARVLLGAALATQLPDETPTDLRVGTLRAERVEIVDAEEATHIASGAPFPTRTAS